MLLDGSRARRSHSSGCVNINRSPASNFRTVSRAVVVHPGTQYASKLAQELADRDMLSSFCTTLAVRQESLGYRILSTFAPSLEARLHRRLIRGLTRQCLNTRPWLELVAHFQVRMGVPAEQALHRRNRLFQQAIPDAVLCDAQAVIGFDTSS